MRLKYTPLAIALLGAISTSALSFADDNERYLVKYKTNKFLFINYLSITIL